MAPRWMFVSDLDDTLLGDGAALGRLMAELEEAGKRLIVVYNSSRPCASIRGSISAVSELNQPDFIIGGMGTEIEDGDGGRLADYEDYLGEGWERERAAGLVAGLGAVPHPEKYQTPFKVSFDLLDSEAFEIVQARLAASGLSAKAVFSSGKFLDLIAARAGKGAAIDFLRQRLGIDAERVVVAGDSGNDVDMFVAPNRGIVVGNADDDLKKLTGDNIYKAERPYAGGVLEGLRYWGVL